MSNPVEVAIWDLYLTRYLTYAAFAVLLYDHATTLSDEIFLIWPAKTGLIKLVFLFNRYTVPLVIAFSCYVLSGQAPFLNKQVDKVPLKLATTILTNRPPRRIYCSVSYTIFTVCYAVVALLTTTFVVATRVDALWGTQSYSFVFLAVVWVIHMVADIVVVAHNVVQQFPQISYEPMFNICQGSVQSSWVVWLNGILFNALMITLLMWAWLSTPRNAQTPLMALIVRDGCVYFVAIFSAMLFNMLMWKYGRESQVVLPFFVVWSTTTIAMSRLLLSMKDVQGPEDWGQQVKIAVPDLELTPIRDGGLVSVISRFSDDDRLSHRKHSESIPKISYVGRYDGYS
ncbi:unnamed protein product [Rhizoctonia solani]|uniref:DUF6533 domain-containing protein n=1 Tax=Rhizoctonia solani TaxID=456999 RepID=A0A8H3DE41_9AGAM|nr:unnamed protein product [Rhizoctonia solani]